MIPFPPTGFCDFALIIVHTWSSALELFVGVKLLRAAGNRFLGLYFILVPVQKSSNSQDKFNYEYPIRDYSTLFIHSSFEVSHNVLGERLRRVVDDRHRAVVGARPYVGRAVRAAADRIEQHHPGRLHWRLGQRP